MSRFPDISPALEIFAKAVKKLRITKQEIPEI
jgi:hypothetical protein